MKDRCCSNPGLCTGNNVLIRPDVKEAKLILRGGEYGLDVIAMVGERHIHGHRSFAEIHQELVKEHGVLISERHVSNLFRLYLALVGARHLDTEAVQARLKAQGRLILSVDAVQFDDVSPRLYVIREVLSGEILAAERIEKADTERLAAFLETAKTIGVPVVGVVTDKERALIAAVEIAFPGVPHQYCQTHFLGHLVKPMESDLVKLGSAVEKVAKDMRGLAKGMSEKEAATPEEWQIANKLCEAVQVISKVQGDKIVDPAALKRFTEVKEIREMTKKAVDRRDTDSPLLTRILAIFAMLAPLITLANRLSRQVKIVREIAHFLGQEIPGKTVEQHLDAYLTKLSQQTPERGRGVPQGLFHRQVIEVTKRFWKGLFACYDVEGLPNNNNALESFFRLVKCHFRRVHGSKSTAGGVLESIAPLVVMLWPELQKRPDLQALFHDLTEEEIQKAREGIRKLAEPAQRRRSFRRDRKGQLEAAMEAFSPKKRRAPEA